MSVTSILLPVFVQVALTIVLLFATGSVRVGAVRRGHVHQRDVALREPNWPKRATQIANAYHNQLESPVLFYVLVAFLLITRQVDTTFVVLAWLFVALRLIHAAIHVTTNRMSRRFYVFLVASTVLAVMWIIFAVRLLSA